MKAKPPVYDDIKYDELCRGLAKQIVAMAIEDGIEDDDSEIGSLLGIMMEDVRNYADVDFEKLRKPKRKGKR